MKVLSTLFLLSVLATLTTISWASRTVQTLAPGINFTQEIDTDTPLVINVVTVDMSAPGVHVESGLAQDREGGVDATAGRESVSRYARRHRALVAVNADFFPFTGDPLGIGIHHGELFSEPWTGNDRGGPRVALGVHSSGKQAVIDRLGFLGDLQCRDGARGKVGGVNRAVGKGEIVVFSPTFAGAAVNKPGGTCVVVTGVNLPLKNNKLMTGTVSAVHLRSPGAENIPSDGLVISGAPGAGADFLAAHLHAGDPISLALAVGSTSAPAEGIKVALMPRDATDLPSRSAGLDRTAVLWGMVEEAVGGGPRLVADGKIAVDAAAEGFDTSFSDSAHPRTAVGIAADGHTLIIVTVDGRQAISRGVSLTAMAGIMKRYGASEAMNLDGGGSTVMAVAGIPVDSPGSSGVERAVADMLVVYSDQPAITMPGWNASGELPGVPDEAAPPVAPAADTGAQGPDPAPQPAGAVRIVPAASSVTVGSGTAIAVYDGDRRIPATSSDLIWRGPAGDGVAFVNQGGFLTGLKPGKADIVAFYRGRLLTAPISVIGKAPEMGTAIVRAALSADPSGAPNRQLLSVHVVDDKGHPFTAAQVKTTVTHGLLDSPTIMTDEDGSASVGITWDGPNGGIAVVSVGSGAPVTVMQGK